MSLIVKHFEEKSSVSVISGWVLQEPHDKRKGSVALFTRPERIVLDTKYLLEVGVGGNLIFRRSCIEIVGYFDETLMKSDDTDWLYRALRKKLHVYIAPDVKVIHHGFKLFNDIKYVIAGNTQSTGMIFGKALKLGDFKAINLIRIYAYFSILKVARRYKVFGIKQSFLLIKLLLGNLFIGVFQGLIKKINKKNGTFI